MECKNGDDSMGARVASCAADGGVGGFAWKTEKNDLFHVVSECKEVFSLSSFYSHSLPQTEWSQFSRICENTYRIAPKRATQM